MASIREDKIDFDKLEKKLNAAVDADRLYWLQNDAKFRAINQKVGSYDEFREMVNAAHLKPLDKTDKIDMDKKIDHPWNAVAAGNSDKMSSSDVRPSSGVKTSVVIPKNNHEFATDWRKRSSKTRAQYLHTIGCDKLLQIFKLEIGFGLLGEIVEVLHANGDILPDAFVCELLLGLCDCGRFQLSLSFLSDKEKSLLRDTVLRSGNNAASATFDKLKEIYGL